jgi:hypothetical protein
MVTVGQPRQVSVNNTNALGTSWELRAGFSLFHTDVNQLGEVRDAMLAHSTPTSCLVQALAALLPH